MVSMFVISRFNQKYWESYLSFCLKLLMMNSAPYNFPISLIQLSLRSKVSISPCKTDLNCKYYSQRGLTYPQHGFVGQIISLRIFPIVLQPGANNSFNILLEQLVAVIKFSIISSMLALIVRESGYIFCISRY